MKNRFTVISGGTIIDGTLAPAFEGDVVLEGDRIADVIRGKGSYGGDVELVDAAGAIVSPGFIDSHSHSDAYLVIEPHAPSKISQGITTEINGQCGGSVAPRYGEARLSSDWAALLGERLVWRSLAEYRRVLMESRPAVNTIQFVGHNTLRSSVVGYAGREATPDEMREMVRLLEKSLDEGAWGLTTGLIYQPGKYASDEEVLALAKAASAKGGFYATHMRSEGDRLLESIDEVVSDGRARQLGKSGRRNREDIQGSGARRSSRERPLSILRGRDRSRRRLSRLGRRRRGEGRDGTTRGSRDEKAHRKRNRRLRARLARCHDRRDVARGDEKIFRA